MTTRSGGAGRSEQPEACPEAPQPNGPIGFGE